MVRSGGGDRRLGGAFIRSGIGRRNPKQIAKKTEEGRAALAGSGKDMLERGKELFERGRQLADEAAEDVRAGPQAGG